MSLIPVLLFLITSGVSSTDAVPYTLPLSQVTAASTWSKLAIGATAKITEAKGSYVLAYNGTVLVIEPTLTSVLPLSWTFVATGGVSGTFYLKHSSGNCITWVLQPPANSNAAYPFTIGPCPGLTFYYD